MTESGLLTVRQTARATHRSEETVRRWIWSGKLPARKLGNQYFIDPADLRRMQAGRTRVAETSAEYKVHPIPLDHPLSDGRRGYDREKARQWLRELVELSGKIAEGKPPFDVTEAIRRTREGR
jgi:excisionase family DNA binding protein